nr:hypothetical protein [Candidatus Sigynarchaeota archaeon]
MLVALRNKIIRVDPNIIYELDRIAKLLGIDQASIIRRILDDGIARERVRLDLELLASSD